MTKTYKVRGIFALGDFGGTKQTDKGGKQHNEDAADAEGLVVLRWRRELAAFSLGVAAAEKRGSKSGKIGCHGG